MAADSQELLYQNAQAAADIARQAALQAQFYADQIAHGTAGAVHTATGGIVDPFVFQLAIFAMACFVGYYVVWAVTPALHTPLMSVTNAISSVIVVGALLSIGVAVTHDHRGGAIAARIFGFIALVLASVNIFGGFLVTERMLSMTRGKTASPRRPPRVADDVGRERSGRTGGPPRASGDGGCLPGTRPGVGAGDHGAGARGSGGEAVTVSALGLGPMRPTLALERGNTWYLIEIDGEQKAARLVRASSAFAIADLGPQPPGTHP